MTSSVYVIRRRSQIIDFYASLIVASWIFVVDKNSNVNSVKWKSQRCVYMIIVLFS